mmetsp:Transcript_54887/g.129695  ORF Transcript_54887/g.129695 Transcript_54887/m.129695 type:complete len:382 (-) Transcript_54887:171-1316(-)
MLVSSPGADRHDSDGEEPEQVYLRRSPPLGKGVTAPHVVNATHALLLRKEAARPTFIPHRRENCTIRPTLRGNVSRMLAPASAADVVLEREKRGGSALNALTLGPLVRLDTDTPTFQKCLQLLDVRATWTGGSNQGLLLSPSSRASSRHSHRAFPDSRRRGHFMHADFERRLRRVETRERSRSQQAHRLEESDEELSRTAETDAYGRWIPSRPTTSLDLPAHWKHEYAGHGSPTHLSPSLRSTGKKKRQSKLGQGSVSRKPCSQGRLRALDNDGHAPNDPPTAASGLHVTESYSYVAERLQDEQRAHEDLHTERLHEEKDSAMQMDSAMQRHASDSLDAWEDLRQEPADEAQATQQLLQENWSGNPVGLRPLVAQSDPVKT